MKKNIQIGVGKNISLNDIHTVAIERSSVSMSDKSSKTMSESLNVLMKYADERMPIYGLNTQFGSQVNILDTNLNGDKNNYSNSLKSRQTNLIKSHNAGMGEIVSEEIVRGSMLLRAHCLSLGHSGVRPLVVESLLNFLNNEIHPLIHKYGSIGASGDLIPLSAIAAALIGDPQSKVSYKGKIIYTEQALKKANLNKLKPEVREGLALINGTSFMTANAALSVYRVSKIFEQLLKAIAMSLESLVIIGSAYNPFVHKLKNHSGSIRVNDFIIDFWKGSKLIRSLTDLRNEDLKLSKDKDGSNGLIKNLQDYYSLRSVPQGFGPFSENLTRAVEWIEEEINSVNDNPIINTEEEKIYHGSNFMGYYITESCDILKMDISQASTWIHAILSNLFHPRKNYGLPANLIEKPEIFNGFRPMHILSAALAVENRKLAQSQQSFMLPTEGDNQDVNSLAVHAAQDLEESTDNLERLTAILFLASTQALELRGVEKSSKKSQEIISAIRTVSPFVSEDRPLNYDVEKIILLMRNSKI